MNDLYKPYEHLDAALVERITGARLGKAQLSPDDITRMWCEIQYAYDELRKAHNIIRDLKWKQSIGL